MGLEEYKQKRQFKKTSEPKGLKKNKKKADHFQGSFVIQKHHARRLHYDFRLELDGVLKSWAVPKGPSQNSSVKRLAVQVEDHPFEYADFEGIIPKGNYGAGEVIIWDRGRWFSEEDLAEGLENGKIEFELEGEVLKGAWILVRTSRQRGSNPEWLLIKRKDEWETKDLRGAPPVIMPMLATLVDDVPVGLNWIHEIKFDGYRTLARIGSMGVELLTRKGLDWKERYGPLASLLDLQSLSGTLIDGEVVWLDDEGRSDFGGLQDALKKGDYSRLYFYVFDLPFLCSEDLRNLPLLLRKELLKEVVTILDEQRIKFSEHYIEEGEDFLKIACDMELEGIVCKKLSSPYVEGRHRYWLKLKCHRQQEFVIGGFTKPRGSRSGFGSLVVGSYENGKLVYRGRVGTGFSQKKIRDLSTRLKELAREASPFEVGGDKIPAAKNVTWVSPELVAEIAFSEWSRDGILIQPSFIGLREDKLPEEITRERPVKTNREQKQTRIQQKVPSSGNKVLWPDIGATKQDLWDHMLMAKELMFPYVVQRPLTLVRCPTGIDQCFYQKRPLSSEDMQGLDNTEIQEKDKIADYAYLTHPSGILTLTQWNCLEIHTWGTKVYELERPDVVVFDLDPGPEVTYSELVEAALDFRNFFRELGLRSFALLTGGKGIHIHVPLSKGRSWQEIVRFSRSVAKTFATLEPKKFTANVRKNKRKQRIFIDWMRNNRGSTFIAPYCVRARPGAPVAVPVTWSEVESDHPPKAPGMSNFGEWQTVHKRDPWAGYFKVSQDLPQIE